jgi:lipopolysaccharide exporter
MGPTQSLAPDPGPVAERSGDRTATDLRVRTARGSLINGVFVVGTGAIYVLQMIIVARVMPTSVFGRWGLVMAVFMSILLLTSVGIDDKYIQQDQTDPEHAFQVAFTLQVVLGGVLAIMILVGIPLFALIYGQSDIIAPGLALIAALPAMALEMPLWVHYRRLDFGRQRRLQLIDPVATFVVTVGLALAGLGLWALVVGAIAGTWAAAIAIAGTSPYRLALRWDRAAMQEYRRFSLPLFVAAMTTVALIQVPIAVSSRVLGVTAVAGISLASNISGLTTRVDDIVTQTLYPVICSVKDQPALLLESFWKSNRLALLWASPAGAATALFAGDFVHLVIGEKWRFAVPLIAVVGINAVINQVGFNWTAFLRALGDTRPVAISGVIGLVAVLVIAIPLLITDGLTAFAVGLGIASVIGVLTRLWYLRRIFPDLSFISHIVRGIGPTVPAVVIVLVLRLLAPGHRGVPHVALEVVVYAVVAGLVTYASDGQLLRESLGYLRRRPLAQASI